MDKDEASGLVCSAITATMGDEVRLALGLLAKDSDGEPLTEEGHAMIQATCLGIIRQLVVGLAETAGIEPDQAWTQLATNAYSRRG